MQVVQSFHLLWKDVPDADKLVDLLGVLLERVATLSPAVALLSHFKVRLLSPAQNIALSNLISLWTAFPLQQLPQGCNLAEAWLCKISFVSNSTRYR